MAASAALTIPVKLSGPLAGAAALEVLRNAAGSSDVSLDAATSKASLRLQMPGAIDHIVRKLASKGVVLGGWVKVSVPVEHFDTSKPVDPTALISHLNASPAVREASFDGETVGAEIYPSTSAMRYLHEELLIAGLKAVDHPTPAGPQDFVL